MIRRFDTPFVGRENEFMQLLRLFEEASERRSPTLVTLLGPAGIGKTRLAAEFTANVQERARVLAGRCLSYGEGITFWPLQEILREIRDRPAEAPDPDQARSNEEVFWAYRKLFEALARVRPLVVILEDIHWAQPTLLDLVEHIVEWTDDVPLLILCLARPELLDERASWPGERLSLEPLPEHGLESIISAVAPDLNPVARVRAAEAAEGNPLFLEQFLALAAEDGDEFVLPDTIQAILAARLDRLEARERALLERAAVIGKEFWRGALVHLSPPDTEVSALLQGLVRKRLARPERSSFPGEDAFRFGHILIRDATYAGIAKETRADLHERFADWLVATGSPYDEIIGYHLEHAHRYRAQLGVQEESLRALSDKAGGYLEQAGERALVRGDPASAANLLERACSLLTASSARLNASTELAHAISIKGDLEKAYALLERTIEEARARGDKRNEWRATVEQAWLGERLAPEEWMPRLTLIGEQARSVFESLGDDLGLARAWNLLAHSFWNGGHYDEAAKQYRSSLEHARRIGDEREELLALTDLLHSMYFGSTPVGEVRRAANECLARVEGSPGWRVRALVTLAGIAALEEDAEEARRLYLEARKLAEELGLKVTGMTMYTQEVGLLLGDAAFAEAELRSGYEQLEEMDERANRSTVAALLGEALYQLGRHSEAEQFADLSLALTSHEDVASHALGRSVKAKLLAERGEYSEAERLAREAVDLFVQTDDLFQQSQVLMGLAGVLEAAGCNDEAIPVLRAAVDVSDRKGNVVTAKMARAHLAELQADSRV